MNQISEKIHNLLKMLNSPFFKNVTLEVLNNIFEAGLTIEDEKRLKVKIGKYLLILSRLPDNIINIELKINSDENNIKKENI